MASPGGSWYEVPLIFTDNHSPTMGSCIQSSPFPASEPGSWLFFCRCSSSCSGPRDLPMQTFHTLWPHPWPPCPPNIRYHSTLTVTILYISHFWGSLYPLQNIVCFIYHISSVPEPVQRLVKNMHSVNTWCPDEWLVKIFQNQVLRSSKQQCYFVLFLI